MDVIVIPQQHQSKRKVLLRLLLDIVELRAMPRENSNVNTQTCFLDVPHYYLAARTLHNQESQC
jgi:hypothetical protein